VRGKTAAVLYADSAERGEDATNVEAIELLVRTAGLVVELVSLRTRKPSEAQPTRTTSGSLVDPRMQASGPLHAQSGQLAQPAASEELHHPVQPSSGLVATPEPQVRPSAWAPPVVEAAHSGSLPGSGTQGAKSDQEEKAHNDARRFARLLVSEIKLYNEQKVSEGRANRDLYDRLKEDIERSRQMYDKRVTPGVAAEFDYFYEELVNTLAEGDAAKLGGYHPSLRA
jgi:hypothetical protein